MLEELVLEQGMPQLRTAICRYLDVLNEHAISFEGTFPFSILLSSQNKQKKKTPWLVVRKRTILTASVV
jgi:hypothetical protein